MSNHIMFIKTQTSLWQSTNKRRIFQIHQEQKS